MFQLINCRTQLRMFAVVTAVTVTVLAVILVACGQTNTPISVQNAPLQTGASTNASEINTALATLAMKTSLPSGDYRIGPEDLLQITLYNIPNAEARITPRTITVRVSQQGLISLPLLGDMKASGLTAAQLETELKKHFEKYIYSPQVGVFIAEYRQRVSVIGAVQKAGVIELTGPKTVIDILAMAGGVTDKAGTQVHIYRQGPNGRESYVIDLLQLASNASLINASNVSLITTPVQAGDVINVPPAGMFFVDGAVRSPGSYTLGRHYSLTQALAVAGGINRELNASDITIFRRKGPSGIEPITVDFDAIAADSTKDVQIEADDVILVPISSMKYVYNRVFGQLLGWGISIAAVAGS
jgi:polysaccharide export outer membrane protein